MKMIKNIIEYLIAIAVIPAIVLAVVHVTELKDVKNVQYELLSEEDGKYIITPGTFEKLMENKKIKNYDIESNYPLITREEMNRATLEIGDIKNEIFIDENGGKRIIENVGQVTFDGTEGWQVVRRDTVTFLFLLSDNHPIYDNYTSNYIVSNDLYIKVSNVNVNLKEFQIAFHANGNIYIGIPGDEIGTKTINEYLSQNPLTVTYELAVKNPKNKVIESSDISITTDYVRLVMPNDFSNNPDGLLIGRLMHYIDRFEVTANWINIYPKDITVTELRDQLIGKVLTYELAQPRPVEVYDFSKFRLVFNKNRIRVIFDIDDGYYLWEITNDDKMIPINGQYDLGNIWTVKFYVYEIQQPFIRTLVLLIPLIVISGLLIYQYDLLKKKGLT